MKLIDIENSRLYKLSSKGALANCLGFSRQQLNQIYMNRNSLYNVKEIKDKNGKPRLTITPVKELRRIHDVIGSHLSVLRCPSYLKSCKGEGYVKNAEAHIDCEHLLNKDINSFFPSSKQEFGFRFFARTLKIPEDVSWFICDLLFKDGILPTGSPVSPSLSFWMHRPVFDEIQSYSIQNNLIFTLYVDDMSFSSSLRIDRKIDKFISAALIKHELKAKKKKTKYFDEHRKKLITGNMVFKGHQFSKNSLYRDIFDTLKKYDKKLTKLNLKELRSTLGKVWAVRSIEGQNKLENLEKNLLNELKRRKAC